MATPDPRIDEYIAKSADFAKPILNHLRDVIHKACPRVEETIKWSFPHFDYSGSILCSMAAFKQHCAFGFWLGSLMSDPHKLMSTVGEKTAMGHFGRLQNLGDLPSDKILITYIKEAMALNEKGVKVKKERSTKTKEIEIPPYLSDALKKNKKASEAFYKFSPSHRKEYLEWITEAKTEATRAKRIATTLERLSEGKSRHWKYQ